MNKTLKGIFIVLAILVAALILWATVFNKGGVLETGWNAAISPINNTWKKISGSSKNLIPTINRSKSTGVTQATTEW